MAENDIAIQVGVQLDTSDIKSQLGAIKENDRKVKLIADTSEVEKGIEKLRKDLQDNKDSNSIKIAVDVLQEESSNRISKFLSDIQKQYEANPVRITLDVNTQATTANINKAVGEMQQQVQKAVDQASKSMGSVAGSSAATTANSSLSLPGASGDTKYWNELNDAIRRYSSAFDDVSARVASWRISEDMEGNARAAVEFKNSVGEITTAIFRLQDVLDAENKPILDENGNTIKEWVEVGNQYTKSFQAAEQAARKMYEELNKGYRENEKQAEQQYQMYDKMFAKIEQGSQKTSDFLSKQETEFNKLYSTAFEQKNPLTGEFADKALDALQKYQDEYQNVMKSGNIATDEQIRKINELRDAASLAITQQQALQQKFVSDKRQDYSGLFGQSKEWEAALKQITDAENKLNEIQKNAFSGTNALTGDFAKEATRQIDEVKNKFAEIRKTAEESFGGAATVSKDVLKKMVDDLKSDLDRLAKLEYPSDKLAAQNVDVKKAFAADALAEMEERLKGLGDSTTEYYNKVQDLKTILSTVGQVDSDPSAWAKFRNEFHMLEDEIKKFEASAQGMGQKLASDLENNQLQQITEMVDRLNNIDEKFNGAGVERLQQSLQSLAQEYMNVIEQLQNPNLSKDEYDALANKVKDLSDQFNQARSAVKIFNDGFKNEGDLRKYEQSADALRMRFEQLQNTYAKLANRNPEIADRFREVENAINGMDPKNIAEVSRQVGNLAKECGNASGQSAGLRGALTDAFGGLGSYIARFTSSYYIITKTIQGIKKMVTAVKEVDTSLVELQKVTNLTGDSLTQFTDKAYQMGAQLGRTGKDVIDAATTFSRAGYDLNEATQLAQSALVMTNVGVDIPNMESAASDMISILKAFDVQVEESMGVIDKLYNVANKEPLDFGNLTEMLVTAGGTLAQAGTSLEETMGLLTGAFATMRTSSVANGLIMISQRLRGMTEDGEAIDGLIPKLQSLFSTVGIGIEDMNGELRSPFEILQDLAAVWDQLSSKQKQYFGEKVAGNRQVKTLNAIMQNWDVVADTIDKANNAQGEALKGNEMYMDSIEGRMTQLQSAFQELAKVTINSDFVKGLTGASTEVIKLVTNLGGLTPVLTTIIGLIVAIKAQKITQGIKTLWTSLSTLFTGMSSGLSLATGWVGILIALAGAFVAIKTAVDNAYSSLKKFEDAKAAYDEQKSKVENLNGELKTTQDRIDELQGKGPLTLIEEKELDDLKEANTELAKQIKYEEELLRIAKQEEKEAAVKNYNDEANRQHKGGFFGEDIHYSRAAENALGLDWLKNNTKMQMDYGTGIASIDQLRPTEIERVNADLEALTVLLGELKNVNEEIKETDPTDDMYGGLQDRKTELNTYIDDTESELLSFYNTLVERTNGFDYVDNAVEGSVDAQMNAMLDLRKQIESAIANAADRNLSKSEIFDNILREYPDAIKKLQTEIKESSDGWEFSIPDDLAQELMSRLDLTIEEVKQLFEQKYGQGSNGLQLDIGPQMNVNVEETIAGLYQVSDGYTKVLTKALSEQEKAGTLTVDTLQKVLGESGLDGIADCLERTANGYRLNTDRINEYINAQNTDIRLNALAGIMERQQALEDLALKYGDVAMAEWAEVDAQNGLIDAQNAATWQNEITELQAVADEAYSAANALDALRAAIKSPNEDADHTEAQDMLEKTQEMIDVGKIGTDDFRRGMDYLLGGDWLQRYEGNIDKAIQAFEAKRKKYFAEDDADSAEAFMDALVKKKLATRNKTTGDIDLLTDDINKVANALGISEDAAQDLFDLLNSYSFEGKFKFGDDAITSADEMAVAENRLQDLQKEREQTTKDLAKAEKELEEARGTSSEEKKQKAVDDLINKQAELEQESKDLTDAINTANDAIEKGFEPPKTLEEALKQITDLQAAIDTLTKEKIGVPIELNDEDGKLTKLIEYISNPSNVLTVDAKPGEIDEKVEELEAFKKAIDENPNIASEVKATVIGITDEVIENLQKFNGQVKKIGDKKGILQRVTIQTPGAKQATIVLQAVEDKAEEVENSDPTVTVKAEEDKVNNAQTVKENVDSTFAEPTNAEIQAEVVGNEEAISTLDNTANPDGEPRIAKIIPEIVGGEEEFEEEWGEFWTGEKLPIDGKIHIDTEQTPEEVASEFKQEWGEFWVEPIDIPVEASIDSEDTEEKVENTIDEIPEQDINVGIDEEQLTGQVEDAVESAKPGDITVNVNQVLKQGQKAVAKDINQTVNVRGKDAGATKAVQKVQNKADEGATIPIDADPSKAEDKDDILKDRIETDAVKPVSINDRIYREADEVDRRLAQEVQKTVKVTYVETNKKPYAKGTKKAEEGVSLVDEKGAELIEHVKQGTFEIGTNDGARLVHLDEGDVVHTADETKKILSRLGNVGGAFRNGLNKIKSFVGNAFANGSVWEDGRVRIRPKKKKDDEKQPSRSSHSGSSSGSHSGSSGSSSGNGEMSAWTDWVNKFFDWAEIKLKKLKDSTTSFIDEAARAIGSIAKNASLNKALDSIKKEIEANEKAFMEYGNTAAEIAAGLSPDIVKKIQQGDIDVSKYDELTQQKIKDYQTWYEKALACREAIKKLEDQQKELAKQSLQNIIDEYSAWAKIANATSGNDAAERELREARGEAVSGPSIETYRETKQGDLDLENGTGSQTEGEEKHRLAYGYGDYTDQIEHMATERRKLIEEREKLQKQLQSLMDQGLVQEGDDTWLEMTAQIKQLGTEATQTSVAIEKLKDEAKEAAMKPLKNEAEDLDHESGKINQETELGNTRGSLGREGKAENYQQLIKNTEEQNKNLEIQNELYRQQQEGLDENSDKYRDLEKKIRENETAMADNEQAAEEYRQAITQLGFEEMEENLGDLTNEAEEYSDAISMNLIKGIEITSDAYQNLIDNGKAQIENLTEQRDATQALMDQLVEQYGEEAKSSDLYQQLKAKVDGLDDSIRDLDMSIAQWGDDMANLELEKLGWQLDALKSKADEFNGSISLKQAQGQAITASDYENLIGNAEEQNLNLEEQNKKNRAKQEGMDVDSKAYQELQAAIEANEKAINSNLVNIEKWKQAIKNIPLEEQAHKVDQLNNENQKYSDTLNLMEQHGKEITKNYYEKMINNADEQIDALNQQKAGYKALMDELVELYGESAKESDLYKQLEDSYNGADQEIRQLTSDMVEWGDAIANIPIEKLNWRLDALKAKAGELNDAISFKQASGQAVTASDYQGLINNANTQNVNLENQNKEYKEQQKGLSQNSKKYQELQAKIEANNEAMRQNNISIEQWKQAMKQVPIEEQAHKVDQLNNENQKYVDTMNLMEQQGKEITANYYKQMLANADGQIKALEQEKAGYKALMDELVELYGESAKESDLYKQLESSYNGVDQEIRNVTSSMVEWGDAIANIPIEKLGWRLDALKAKAGELNDTVSFKQASGQAVTKEDYQGLIDNANAQNANLENQNKEYKEQQEGLDKNSKKYRKLQADIDANNEAMRQNNISIEQWKQAMKQLPIEEQAHKVDQLSNENQKYVDTMNLMEQQGKEITAKYYKQMLANADEQIAALEQQKAGYKALMDELVKLYGESAKESDLYKQLESSFNGVDQEIRSTTASMVEWGDAIANIPIEKLGWKLDALQDKAGRFNDAISFKQASGQAVTKKDYKNLINNAEAQNKILEKENERYKKQQEGLDKNSKKYQELQAKINANDEAIRQNQISTEQWKDAMEQIPIEKRAHQLDVLSAKNNEYNDALEHTKQIGKEVTSQHYQVMIDNANQEIKVLEKQKASYKALMDELVNLYGESAKESDVYKQLEQQWYSVGESIRSATSSITEWEKSIEELNVEKLGWSLDAVENRVDEFNDAITFKNASGQAVMAKDYHYLVGSAVEANRILEDQNKVYKEMQNGMDVNSEEYQRLQGLINSNNKAIRQNLVSIEEWEKAIKELPIEKQSHELEQLNTVSEEYNDNLKQRELLGKETVAGDYQVLIDINKESIKILNDQSAAYRALMSNLVSLYGETAKESELYKSYEKALSDTEKQTRDLTVATIELEKSMADLELEKLGWQLDALAGQSDRITNLQSLNEAQGLEKTADAYKQLIENGLERIKILEQQNKLLREQQEGMDVNSKAYQDIEKQILTNENEIENMKIAQEQWNDSIVDIGINNIQQYKDSLAKSNEQLERQKSIQKAMQDLMKADTQRKVRTYVEGQGFVYQRDEDEYQQAQENLESILQDQLMGKLDDLIEALEDAKKNTNVYDKDGNLIGSVYETPELGNLADVLAEFYNKNKNATINIDTLREAFGKESVSSVNKKNTSLNIGDIVINEVKDGNDLARAIIDQFPNALLQAMFAK